MKKILIVRGGGRPNGNTAQLAAAFAGGAREAGHTVEEVSLSQVQVNGCLGCNACRYQKPCVQKDGWVTLMPKILDADLLVLASPLYFWTISSKLKAFIERFYSIAAEDPAPPMGRYERYPEKDCALLMTAADNYFWTFEQAVSSGSMTGGCCWRGAAAAPTAGRVSERQGIWKKLTGLGRRSIRSRKFDKGGDPRYTFT